MNSPLPSGLPAAVPSLCDVTRIAGNGQSCNLCHMPLCTPVNSSRQQLRMVYPESRNSQRQEVENTPAGDFHPAECVIDDSDGFDF
jgi:hypothetical protein